LAAQVRNLLLELGDAMTMTAREALEKAAEMVKSQAPYLPSLYLAILALRDSLPQEGALANFKMPFYPDECAAGSNLGSPRSVQNDTVQPLADGDLAAQRAIHDSCLRSETVKPDTAKDAEKYRWLTSMWPLQITRLVHNFHTVGPTSSDVHGAIDAAMLAAAPSPSGVEESKP
jgi:hypothetical protein